jgi:hypothetical protein
MQLTSASRYPAGEHNRILVIGPSEAREAFWPGPFKEALGDVRLVNDSLSLSTFEDAITQLDYVEQAYGKGRLGELIIVAVTPRFLEGYAPGERPLPIVINRYSPYFNLDETVEPQALVRKGSVESLGARIRLTGHSGVRFMKALWAVAVAVKARSRGEDLEAAFRSHNLVGARFYLERPRDKTPYYELAKKGSGLNPVLRNRSLLDRRTEVIRDFGRLKAIASRNGAQILVVNMPEGGWARRGFYAPGVHESYMAVLREASGDLPLLDLREALDDDGFVDWVHPTMAASLKLSRKVAVAIREMELQ